MTSGPEARPASRGGQPEAPTAAAVSPAPVTPVEIAPPGGPLLRGLCWVGEPGILLLHAPGGDLDDWRDLPPLLAQRTGLGTLALDLPGHGLSAGAPADAALARLPALVRALLDDPAIAGVRAVVAAGESALALLHAAAAGPLAGIVCLSPDAPGTELGPLPRSPRVPKLLLAHSGDGDDLPRTRQLANTVGGWTVVIGLAGQGPGAALLDGPAGSQSRDKIAGFLRQCLHRP